MEGVTGAMWVGMQSLEHAFKNNQRLEIKSRQRSTAQHSSSVIHGPAAAQSVTEQNTLPAATAQSLTGFSSRAKTAQQVPTTTHPLSPPPPSHPTPPPKGQAQESEHLCLPRSAVPAQREQHGLWISNLSNCNRTTKNRLHQTSHCANNSESSWPSSQNFSKLTFRQRTEPYSCRECTGNRQTNREAPGQWQVTRSGGHRSLNKTSGVSNTPKARCM